MTPVYGKLVEMVTKQQCFSSMGFRSTSHLLLLRFWLWMWGLEYVLGCYDGGEKNDNVGTPGYWVYLENCSSKTSISELEEIFEIHQILTPRHGKKKQ